MGFVRCEEVISNTRKLLCIGDHCSCVALKIAREEMKIYKTMMAHSERSESVFIEYLWPTESHCILLRATQCSLDPATKSNGIFPLDLVADAIL